MQVQGVVFWLSPSISRPERAELAAGIEAAGGDVEERRTSKSIVVMPSSFDTAEFQTAMNRNRLVLGVAALREALVRGHLPDLSARHPAVANAVLADVVLTHTGVTQEESRVTVQLARYMGARVSASYTSAVTHLIAHAGYESAKTKLAKERGDKIIVPAWITACWSERSKLNEADFSSYAAADEDLGPLTVSEASTSEKVAEKVTGKEPVEEEEREMRTEAQEEAEEMGSPLIAATNPVGGVGGAQREKKDEADKEEAPPPPPHRPPASSGVFLNINLLARGFGDSDFDELAGVIQRQGGVLFNGKGDEAGSEPPPYIRFVILPHGSDYERSEASLGTSFGSRRPVASPNWLESCIIEKKLLDPTEAVIFQPLPCRVPLKGTRGVNMCITGFTGAERRRVRDLAKMLGFRYAEKMTSSCQVLVCSKPTGNKCMCARGWNVPVVGLAWLLECAAEGTKRDFGSHLIPSHELPLPPSAEKVTAVPIMLGATVMINRKGVSPRVEQRLQKICGKLGATFAWKYTPNVTHIVHQGRGEPKELKAALRANPNLYVVNPMWLERCLENGIWLDETDFPPSMNPNMTLGITVSVAPTARSAGTKRPASVFASAWPANKKAKASNGTGGNGGNKKKKKTNVVDIFREKERQDRLEEVGAVDGFTRISVDMASDIKMDDVVDMLAEDPPMPENESWTSSLPTSATEVAEVPPVSSSPPPALTVTKDKAAYMELEKLLTDSVDRLPTDFPVAASEAKSSCDEGGSEKARGTNSENILIANGIHMDEEEEEEEEEEEQHSQGSQVVIYKSKKVRRESTTPSKQHSGADRPVDAELNSLCKALSSSRTHVEKERTPGEAVTKEREPAGRAPLFHLEDMTESPMEGPEATGEAMKRVFAFTGGAVRPRKELDAIIRGLGGEVASTADELSGATHVVISKLVRSAKMIAVVANGGWVMKYEYVEACVEAGAFVDERPYEWTAGELTPTSKLYDLATAGRRWRLWLSGQQDGKPRPRAFEGMRVMFVGNKFTEPLAIAVMNGGGCVAEEKKLPLSDADVTGLTHVLVEQVSKLPTEKLEQLRALRDAVPGLWVIDCKFVTELLLKFPIKTEDEFAIDFEHAIERSKA